VADALGAAGLPQQADVGADANQRPAASATSAPTRPLTRGPLAISIAPPIIAAIAGRTLT
jgi:hypothetical protein